MSSFGRRVPLLLIFTGICLSSILGGTSTEIWQLLISRVLSGFFSGMATIVPSVYITEMVPLHSRSFASLLPQIAANIGVLLGIVVGFPLVLPTDHEFSGVVTARDWLFDKCWWRLMLLFPLPICIAAAPLLQWVYVFDTPSYLRYNGKMTAAHDVETILFGNFIPSVQFKALTTTPDEPEDLIVSTNQRHRQKSLSVHSDKSCATLSTSQASDISQPAAAAVEKHRLTTALHFPGSRYRLIIGWSFAVMQQLTGINVFVSASNLLFLSAGVPSKSVTMASACMATLALVATIASSWILNRFSRRVLLTGGGALMTMSLLPVLFLEMYGIPAKWTSVCSTLLFITVFSSTYGPGLFVYLNEVLPVEVKDSALAIAFGLNWFACFVVVIFSPMMSTIQGYAFFTSCTFFGHFFAPETKTSIAKKMSEEFELEQVL